MQGKGGYGEGKEEEKGVDMMRKHPGLHAPLPRSLCMLWRRKGGGGL